MFLSLTGLDSTIADNILTRLKAGRQYLKTDFKIHTASESPCAEHCRMFALSRPDTEYKGQCQHQHTISCDRCEDLKNAVSDLQLAADSREYTLGKNIFMTEKQSLVFLVTLNNLVSMALFVILRSF